MTMFLRDPTPVVRHTTGLHHYVRRWRLGQKPGELRAIQSLARDDAPLSICDGELEDSLCEVNGHCRSIHLGLLLVALMVVS